MRRHPAVRHLPLAVPLCLLAAAAPAQDLKLVANISAIPTTGNGSSQPQHLTLVGNAVLFAADDGATGIELWRTEGRPNTTRLVKDIRLRDSSWPDSFTPAGARTWFVADDDAHGRELWVTDGTTTGTRLVADIAAGIADSIPGDLTPFGNLLFFTADDRVHGREPWVSDGTAAGTRLLRDLNPGEATSGVRVPTVMGGHVYFFADDGVVGSELWRSDGTPAGTHLVVDLQPGGSTVPVLRPVADEARGVLYFVAFTSAVGTELWRTDGSAAGTRLVVDLTPGPGSTRFFGVTLAGGVLYFSGQDELWRSDGTAAGTTLVRPVAAGGPRGPTRFTVVRTRVFFMAFDPVDLEPWVSDGTAAGTFRLADTGPGSAQVAGVAVDGARVFFAIRSGGGTLWVTDLTTAGTRLVAAVPSPEEVTARPGGGVVFLAQDARGRELWASDGTAAGTGLLVDLLPPSQDEGSSPYELMSMGHVAVFSADDGVHGRELWRTDGTAAGTAMVVDLWPGAMGSYPSQFVRLQGRVLFTASGPSWPFAELWATDGSSAGTVRLVRGDVHVTALSAVRSDLAFFMQRDASGRNDAFVTDGTPGGTRRLAALAAHPRVANVAGAVRVDAGHFAMFEYELGGPSTLWWSDGTAAGTRAVTTVPGDFAGWNAHLHRGGGGRLFFRSDPQRFRDLWVSDGTAVGTVLLHADAQTMFVDDDAVWIVDTTRTLWRGDGSPAGLRRGPTFPVPGPGPTTLTPFAMWDGAVLLEQRGISLGQTLWWRSDGTVAGTRLLTSLRDNVEASEALGAGRRVVMTRPQTQNPSLSITLSSVDRLGTTKVLAELRRSVERFPPFTTLTNGRVLVMHDDGVLGDELWMLDPGAVAQAVAAGCAGPGREATLRCDDPILGRAMLVTAAGTPPSAVVAALWLGRPETPLPRVGPCALVGVPEVLLAAFQPTGGSWLRLVPLPNALELVGVTLALQAMWGPTDAALGIDVSDGVLLTLGR